MMNRLESSSEDLLAEVFVEEGKGSSSRGGDSLTSVAQIVEAAKKAQSLQRSQNPHQRYRLERTGIPLLSLD